MNKRAVFFGLFFAIILLFNVSAQELPQYTDKYVNDFAGIFSASEISDLRALSSEIKQNTTAEFVVVSVAKCDPYAPSQYAHELFNQWGVGKADKDNGLLALYCQQENKIWVEVGYGLEGILPDSKVGRMLDDYYVPLRDAGNLTDGILLFSTKIADVLNENKQEIISGQAGNSSISLGWIIFTFFIIFIPIFIFLIILFKINKKAHLTQIQSGKNNKLEKESKKKKSYGIKKDTTFVNLSLFISIIAVFVLAIFINAFLAFILFFIFRLIMPSVRGIRCEKDNLRMKYIGKDKDYRKYKCKNGHIGGILIAVGGALGLAHGGGSSFSGGGFGGGGGGFGGGGSGGGGAGR